MSSRREQPPAPDAPSPVDSQTQKAIRELLDLLPPDVVAELNRGELNLNDPSFFEGLTDHVSRQSLADPQTGRRLLGKLIKLKKLIARDVRDSHPEAAVSSTVTRNSQHVGRNLPCPCGSGKKFKHCCLRKK
jgi:hypothetical protein